MVPALAGERDLLEQALLEWLGPKLDRTEKDLGPGDAVRALSAAKVAASYGTKSPLFQ